MHKATRIALVAAFSGFLFGFDTAVISGAEQALQDAWSVSDAFHGLLISAALWGTVAGALMAARPLDRFGRHPVLIVIGILYLASALGSALAWSPSTFAFARFIGGIAVGASSIAAPLYIAEIAPAESRGRLGVFYQFFLVVGILAAFLSNFLLAVAGFGSWRLMLGAEAAPALLFLILAVGLPESPRWQGAFRQDRADVPAARLLDPAFAMPMLVAFLLAFFNQASGINAVLYFAPRIFGLAGSDTLTALLSTIGIGVVNVIFTVAGLMLIDRVGRRMLMIIGSAGYIVSLFAIAASFWTGATSLVAPLIFLFIASHAIGQGTVIWIYISEIFPDAVRAKGQALGCGTHWVMAAIVSFAMPVLLASVPPATVFTIFGLMMILQLIFVLTLMVETKGRTLGSADSLFTRRRLAV